MNYRNTEMKVDQIVSYLNEEKINLSPAFQRGHVWKVGVRRKLIANMVQGRPIPAIFLYKEAEEARYTYNILDGKQRLESLILFIASQRTDLTIQKWHKYFFTPAMKGYAGFWIPLPNGNKTFGALDGKTVADFREYAIPTVEITVSDDTHLDEVINLFVDINQQGVPVKRFDIVKAMGSNNRLLKSVFDLIAIEQKRAQDIFYKAKANAFTYVLKSMQIISSLSDGNSQVDRMWERLLEIALLARTKQHRKPADILKSFIRGKEQNERFPKLSAQEIKGLRAIFDFLAGAYKKSGLRSTPLATDQAQFYTLITTLIATNLRARYGDNELIRKLERVGNALAGKATVTGKAKKALRAYNDVSGGRASDAPRRVERQEKFVELVEAM